MSAANPILGTLRALYGPTVSEQLEQLADATAGIANAAADLRKCPTAERAERLATWLGGAQRTAATVAHQLGEEKRPQAVGGS